MNKVLSDFISIAIGMTIMSWLQSIGMDINSIRTWEIFGLIVVPLSLIIVFIKSTKHNKETIIM